MKSLNGLASDFHLFSAKKQCILRDTDIFPLPFKDSPDGLRQGGCDVNIETYLVFNDISRNVRRGFEFQTFFCNVLISKNDIFDTMQMCDDSLKLGEPEHVYWSADQGMPLIKTVLGFTKGLIYSDTENNAQEREEVIFN